MSRPSLVVGVVVVAIVLAVLLVPGVGAAIESRLLGWLAGAAG